MTDARIFYDEFHKRVQSPTRIIKKNDFIYKNVLLAIDDLNIKPDDLVLDFGCGNGILSFYVSKTYGCKVIGIDISEKAINAAKASPLMSPKVQFVVSDIFKTDLSKFEKIICSEVMEHLPDDEKLLRKFRQILNKDGTVLITAPLESFLIHKIQKKIFGYDRQDVQAGHLRRYTLIDLTAKAKKYRFVVSSYTKKVSLIRWLVSFFMHTPFSLLNLIPIRFPYFFDVFDTMLAKLTANQLIIILTPSNSSSFK